MSSTLKTKVKTPVCLASAIYLANLIVFKEAGLP